jgi:hypothetical protein
MAPAVEPYSIGVQRSRAGEIIDAFAARHEIGLDGDLIQLRAPYISIFDRGAARPARLFHPHLGSMRLPAARSVSPVLSDFFCSRRDSYSGGHRYGRGYSYYCYEDKAHGATTIPLLSHDIVDGIRAIGCVDRSRLTFADYRFYMAILDHIKNGFLQLHRFCSFARLQQPSGTFGVGQHVADALQHAATEYTRAYYHALAGTPLDLERLFGESGLKRAMQIVADIDSIAARIDPEILPWLFDEGSALDHPLLIGLQALQYAALYPSTDTILAMPAHGAQLAIVLQLALQALGISTDLNFLHYAPQTSLRLFRHTTSSEWLQQQLLRLDLAEKHILVVDDSILNGLSLQELTQALAAHRPASIHAAIARADVVGMRKWSEADTVEELEHALAIVQAAMQHDDVPASPDIPNADTTAVSLANPWHPDLKVIGLAKQDNLEDQDRRAILQIYPFRTGSDIAEADRRLRLAQRFAAQIGVLLVKPDAVGYGIAEELIHAAQARLIQDNVALTGVAVLTIPGDAGHKLYPTLHPDNRAYNMESYLTRGESVVVVFRGDGSLHVTNRLRQIEGRPIWNYSARELVTLPYGLQDSLRGIIPVPGAAESYRRGIRRLLQDRLGLTTSYEHWEAYEAVTQTLVHVAADVMELCGLLSLVPSTVLTDALGDLYRMYELVSRYYGLAQPCAEPPSGL